MVVVFYSDDPSRFGTGTSLLLGDRPVEIVRVRSGKDGQIVALQGVGDRNEAETLKGSVLYLSKSDRRELEPGEYWPEDLVGLEAFAPEGQRLGVVAEVVLDAAQPRLVVAADRGNFEIPFVDELVPEVRLAEGHLIVDPVDGLL